MKRLRFLAVLAIASLTILSSCSVDEKLVEGLWVPQEKPFFAETKIDYCMNFEADGTYRDGVFQFKHGTWKISGKTLSIEENGKCRKYTIVSVDEYKMVLKDKEDDDEKEYVRPNFEESNEIKEALEKRKKEGK